jgi:3'-phosphoadenosine 5'-phosphosulfate sulfotransferase (PAPS reductase)/FAD synthetase
MYLDINCVEAARQRVRHVYDIFDTVCVQFSGGKDSTAALYLAKEVHEERGLGPVKAIFRDEEFVSPAAIEFVTEVSQYDWVDMEWYCLPQLQEVWYMGMRQLVLLWSAFREECGMLLRDFPENAIRAEAFGLSGNMQLPRRIDEYTMQGKRGSVAFITGVRANESMVRYRSVTQKLHENYINRPQGLPKGIPLRFAKILYDWTSDDVLKFIHEEHNASYCKYYDYAALGGANQRVGTPLFSTAARRLTDVIKTEPEFYDSLIELYPEIETQVHLWGEYDIELLVEVFSDEGWDGVKECIDIHFLDEDYRRYALTFADKFRSAHKKDPYAYPLDHLVRTLLLNAIMGSPSPVGPQTIAHKKRLARYSIDDESMRLADADSLDLQDDYRIS